ncbi:hypothetical protein FACS1894163_10270 [Spirochaetia bacterium]|nr:hypothetical protein FACS1894163_10270 [Spirochaetia bacterium]
MKTILGMTLVNLRNSKNAYLVGGIIVLLGLLDPIIWAIMSFPSGDNSLAVGNYLFLLPLFMAIFTPAQNFSKLMNLGGKRMDFFKSGILVYGIASAAVSLAALILYYSFDRAFTILSLYDVFGFMRHGPVTAFFQMTVFLSLFCAILHTLTLSQGRWYGWAADIAIVAIISVFTPIAPLRAVLRWFFTMIIFHEAAVVQILSCAVLGAVIYCGSLIPIKTRGI